MRALMILAATIALSGCTSLRAEWEHTSHPFAGEPFGPANEEDVLDTANLIARRQSGRFYTEAGLGWKLADGGFYGPELTFTYRAGVELWSRN